MYKNKLFKVQGRKANFMQGLGMKTILLPKNKRLKLAQRKFINKTYIVRPIDVSTR